MVLSLSLLNAQEVYATFHVEAQKSADLALSSSGIVNSVKVDIGSVVKKGQTLVSLENSDTRSMLAIAKANLKTAQVSANYAQKEYNRQSKVKHLLDDSAFDKFAQNREVNYATVSQLKANLKYQEILLKKTSLYAPFDGIIYEKLVEVGDVVSGQMIRTILKIQSTHDVKLIVAFDEKYWDKVKKGDTFKYKLTGSDKNYEGKISKVYPNIDNKTHKLKAEVNAKNIKVGLFGTGTIVTE
ncbi:MAG: Membrane fusion protein of RND family multidrug efflux pump [uncultured Sulfurovum sp.]|uniref:Membrane fusion protein of RND family multidrug efflux pump n=1 Tax=uncultured Sulfurovum sp. TaxID=269237 RepID=A0A6S6SGE9_9BACT|nr:MAG: Membrane fusion protein of RND family multidrug efflux pump [uncultured Sulfurovum sp.]